MRIRVVVFTIIIVLSIILSPTNATQRLVLCEMFTNTSCSYCYNANIVLDELVDEYSDYMAAIRYHVDWPSDEDPFYLFTPSENGIRKSYYGITGVPYLQVDGIIDVESYSQYWSVISNRYTEPSPVEIVMDGTFNEASRTGSLTITVTATDTISLDGLFLRVALTESNIYYYAPNGLRYHNQTMRYMFPYSLGTRIYLTNPGDVAEVELDIWCNEPLVIENCELVAFVQSDYNKEVLQATKLPVTSLDYVDVDDDEVILPHSFQLEQNYPNPFNAGTVISYQLEKDSRVDLAIYDILGQKITTLIDTDQAAGYYRISWDGHDSEGNPVASGMYFYKLTSGGKSESKRMMLVK